MRNLSALYVVVLAFFFLDRVAPTSPLLAQNPSLIISKETTYATSPIRPDGQPDYEKYLLERLREGVTPDENAAALLWRACGFDELKPDLVSTIAKEIGLDTVPDPKDCLVRIPRLEAKKLVANWLVQEGRASMWTSHYRAESIFIRAKERPWTGAEIPPLAEWPTANEKPLNLLVEASLLPRFYSPFPELLNDKADALSQLTNPVVELVRDAAYSLTVRAMWHAGEGRFDAAWTDILAIYNWSRLVGQGRHMVEVLNAMALERVANAATLALLDSPNLPIEIASRIELDLESLESRVAISEAIDQFERIIVLDALLSVRNGTSTEVKLDPKIDVAKLDEIFDWNIPLRNVNAYFDELSEAAKLTLWSARKAALDDHEERLTQLAKSMGGGTLLWATLSREKRSEALGNIYAAVLIPGTSFAYVAEDRLNCEFALIRLAAAIAYYRGLNGEYPDSLDKLVPQILYKLPVSLYANDAFVYRRTENGYILYSLGPNGQDDKGCNKKANLFHGYSTDTTSADEFLSVRNEDDPVVRGSQNIQKLIPEEADDIAIRVPLPKLVLPKRAEPKAK